jgi:hypothetical protein
MNIYEEELKALKLKVKKIEAYREKYNTVLVNGVCKDNIKYV